MTTIERKRFARVVRSYREEKDLTQNELASLVSTTSNTVARWERGETVPKNQLMVKRLKEIGIAL